MKLLTKFSTGLALLLMTSSLTARADEDFQNKTLEDFLNISAAISSNTNRSLREQPGIVTIIKADDIAKAGARDFIDVLRLVPGFDFGHDVLGHNGWAFRGQWAIEGKIMLIWDGMVYNDPLYGNIPMDGRFPVDLIDTVEIIRGPGSAKYGGYAELAVVKVTTKGANLKGGYGSVMMGQMERGFGRAQLNAAVGNKLENSYYSASVYAQTANMSDRVYSDGAGGSWDTTHNSKQDLKGANLNYGYGGLDLRVIVDRYKPETANVWGSIGDKVTNESNTDFASIKYDWKATSDFTVTPSISYQRETQYKLTVTDSATIPPSEQFNVPTERMTETLNMLYTFNKDMNVSGGLEYMDIKAKAKTVDDLWTFAGPGNVASTFFHGKDQAQFSQLAAYAQGEYYSDLANLTIGGRYVKHSEMDESVFVPRMAVTKVMDKLGLKAMYSGAYRVGDIGHFQLANEDLKPEKSWIGEFETSWAFNPNNVLALNVFDIQTRDAITYTSSNTTHNLGTLHSQGFELEWKLARDWGSSVANYSFYQGSSDSVASYRANEDDRAFLGLARNKASWQLNYDLSRTITLSPSAVYLGERIGRDGAGNETTYNSTVLAALFVHYTPFTGLTASAGVHDAFQEQYHFIQGYQGGIAPMPGPSREYDIKVSYSHPF